MLNIFKNQRPYTVLILIAVLLLTRIPFLFLENVQLGDTYWGLNFISFKLSMILTMIIVFGQAIWINYLFTNANFFEDKTVIPALVWILLSAFDEGFLVLGFPVLSSTLLIVIIQILMSIKGSMISLQACFQLGIIVGALSYFHPVTILVLPFFIFIIYFFNTMGVREYLLFFMAIALSFFWIWTYLFLNNLKIDWLERLMHNSGLPLYTISMEEIIIWSVVLLFVIGGFSSMFLLMRSSFTKKKKNIISILVLFLSFTLVCLLSKDWDFSNIMMCLVPASMMISVFLLIIRKRNLANILFATFVLGSFGTIVTKWVVSF